MKKLLPLSFLLVSMTASAATQWNCPFSPGGKEDGGTPAKLVTLTLLTGTTAWITTEQGLNFELIYNPDGRSTQTDSWQFAGADEAVSRQVSGSFGGITISKAIVMIAKSLYEGKPGSIRVGTRTDQNEVNSWYACTGGKSVRTTGFLPAPSVVKSTAEGRKCTLNVAESTAADGRQKFWSPFTLVSLTPYEMVLALNVSFADAGVFYLTGQNGNFKGRYASDSHRLNSVMSVFDATGTFSGDDDTGSAQVIVDASVQAGQAGKMAIYSTKNGAAATTLYDCEAGT